MRKDDLILLIIGLLLVAGMVITMLLGGERSRHGIGQFFNQKLKNSISLHLKHGFDLGQSHA